MTVQLLHGDCREVLKKLPNDSIDCCVSSAPYWGLRSYLPADHPNKHLEIGSEPTLQEWVDTMVLVFRDVRRVLKPRGTLWLNLGDAYVGTRGKEQGPVITGNRTSSYDGQVAQRNMTQSARRDNEPIPRSDVRVTGLKAKDMMGQPWRVAFALQDDGWWLRQEIIWHKPNPMPESTRDRCTKAHEHVFLLSKSEKYFYDFDAMQEPVTGTANARRKIVPAGWAVGDTPHTAAAHQVATNHRKVSNGVGFGHGYDAEPKPRTKSSRNSAGSKNNSSMDEALAEVRDTRNPRSVWTIPTHPFKGSHFATFPPELAARCLTAGCPEGGTALDPFGGSGTVGLVADRQHKHAILIDLDERNGPMAEDRIRGDSPLFAEVTNAP